MNGNIIATDRRTLYLLSNGDIMPWSNQKVYEFAWAQGIRPLDEGRLKPGLPQRRRSGELVGRIEMVDNIDEGCFA